VSETLVRMPKLAATLVEGTLGQWLKRVGEVVRQGEPLASIETDKVTTELTSPAAGTLLEVLVADGQTVPIETPIARIGEAEPAEGASRAAEEASRPIEGASRPGEGASRAGEGAARPTEGASRPGEGASRPTEGASRPGEGASRPGEGASRGETGAAPRKATPMAARLLAEHGLKPEDVRTSSGRVTKEDVLS